MSQSMDIADTVVFFCREHNIGREAMIDLYARLRVDTDADWDDADPRIEATAIINGKCNVPNANARLDRTGTAGEEVGHGQ